MELFVRRQNAQCFLSGAYSEFNQEQYIAFMTEGKEKSAA
jgi:hypothetical protein